MKKIVECVPNFSEGKDTAVIQAIAGAIISVDGVKLLNVDPGADFHRTVYTLVGEPTSVVEAAFQAAKIGVALIDMRNHKGEHARMGALDVMPFIPIKGVTMDDCVELSKQFGKRMASELGVPVFLYAHAAVTPERVRLPDIRKGEYEALEEKFKQPSFAPDFGKPVFVAKSGATATGAREILLAYNVNLSTNDKSIASEIAGRLRTSGVIKKDEQGQKVVDAEGRPVRIPGRFKGVQAGGMMYNEKIAQISMNLLDYQRVNLHDVYEAIKQEAEQFNVSVTGSEIVGVVPKDALVKAGRFYAQKKKIHGIDDEESLVALAIEQLGLSDLSSFNPEEKVIEYMVEEGGRLAGLCVKQFLSELASNSPAPGGGSVAAFAGALGSALSSMVCNLTIGKDAYKEHEVEMKSILQQSEQLRKELTVLIDKDTEAFNQVMQAFKLPKETQEQKSKRSQAIQKAYKSAAEVPMQTALICAKVLDVALVAAQKGNPNSITDAGVSALLAQAGVKAAILNVNINLGSIKDTGFVKELSKKTNELQELVDKKTGQILKLVNQAF